MKTTRGSGVGQGFRVAIALALSLLGLAFLPMVALPYGSLDWVLYDPAYRQGLSAPSIPPSSVTVPETLCTEPLTPGEALVARVNDQGISQEAFERELAQFLRAWESLGNALESAESQAAMPAFRRQVLDLLIDDVLVQQAAVEAGIRLSREEIQARMAEEVFDGGGPEVFQAWLAATGQSWEEYERDVCQDLLRQALRERVSAGEGATPGQPLDPDTQDAQQAQAFQQWLATRREAARIELYSSTD